MSAASEKTTQRQKAKGTRRNVLVTPSQTPADFFGICVVYTKQ